MALSIEEIRSRKRTRYKAWYDAKRDSGIDPITARARRRKQFVLGLIGRKCQICGYAKCEANLAFHHVLGKDRGLSIKAFQCRTVNLVEEIKKCVAVCSNCHGEIHNGLVDPTKIAQEHERLRSAFIAHLSAFLPL